MTLEFGKGTVYEKGYGMVSKIVMQDPELTIEGKAIYSYIASYAGAEGEAYPSVSLICGHLGINKKRFYKHVKKLLEKNYIAVKKHKEKGKFANNVYEIISRPCTENADTENADTENVPTKSNSLKSNSCNSNKHNRFFPDREETGMYLENGDPLLDDILDYYYQEYEIRKGKKHPRLKASQLARVYETLLSYNLVGDDGWKTVIANHFNRNYGKQPDYNINHFATKGIIDRLMMETNVLNPTDVELGACEMQRE